MKKINFPFITILFIGIIIMAFILGQAIIKAQRSSIAEEEMRLNSIKQEVFVRNFDYSILLQADWAKGDFVEFCKKTYNEFIEGFLSDERAGTPDQYRIRYRATEESLEAKESGFLLNAFAARKHQSFLRTLIGSATAMLIHLNPLHLILTLMLLWIIGINAEHMQGLWYFLFFGIGGPLLNFFAASMSSGEVSYFGFAPGICLILGAYVYYNYDEEAYLIFPGVVRIYGIFLLFFWVIYEAVLALVLHTENYKTFSPLHIAGILAGVGIAAVFKVSRPPLESNISKEALSPVEMARRDMKMGNYRGAINQLGDILRRDSTNEEALRLMMQAYITSRGQQDCIGLASYLLPDLMNKKKGKIAFDLFMDFSNAFPKASLSAEAQFAAGKLLIENNFYELSVDTLAKVTQMVPGTDLCVQAVFEIGKIQMEKLNQSQNAAAMFNWIVQNFPTHPLAGPSRQMMLRVQPQ